MVNYSERARVYNMKKIIKINPFNSIKYEFSMLQLQM